MCKNMKTKWKMDIPFPNIPDWAGQYKNAEKHHIDININMDIRVYMQMKLKVVA